MLEKTSTQLLMIKHSSQTEQQSKEAAMNNSLQSLPESSPYWTPIALYYLEREAEWARG